MSKKDEKFDRRDEDGDTGTYQPRTGNKKTKKVHRPSSDTQKPVSKKFEPEKKPRKEEFQKETPKGKPFSRKPSDKGAGEGFKKKDFDHKKGFEKKSFEEKSFDKKPSDRKKPLLRRGGQGDKGEDRFGGKKGGVDNKKKRNFKDDPKKNKLLKRNKDKKRSNTQKGSDHIPEYDFKKINKFKKGYQEQKGKAPSDEIRLNRYIANAGVCSRREADDLIAEGLIKVNGTVVKQLGTKVKRSDEVTYKGQTLSRERKVYVLLNKPRNYLTTMDDPKGRRTVMGLVGGACEERIYPVGRLDRNTTGLLLFTNDGELATALAHPSSNVKKVYRVELTKPLDPIHFEQLSRGIELEDGFMKPDNIAINELDPRVVGVEIHSGRNRIVRRMFEHFEYEVDRLDRTAYAGLTKKDIPRGKWRFLKQSELIRLKHFEKFKG